MGVSEVKDLRTRPLLSGHAYADAQQQLQENPADTRVFVTHYRNAYRGSPHPCLPLMREVNSPQGEDGGRELPLSQPVRLTAPTTR